MNGTLAFMKLNEMMLLRNLIILLCFALPGWQCSSSRGGTVPYNNERPNIIFLLADDLRFDAIGYAGNRLAITPNLDSLAGQGTNFKNTYVTSAICAISRASIFSGQYARRHGIDDFSKNFSDSALQYTYPLLLRGNGYYTGFIGKYGVGSKMPVNGFDYWKGFGGHGVYFYKNPEGKMEHETAMMGRQAQEFIEGRDPSKPFCLSVSFKAPHSEDGVTENGGFRPDPFFKSWYNDISFPYPATYADSFYYRFSPAWRRDQRNKENEARVRWDMRFSTPAKFQTTYKAIYQLVSGIDQVVGEMRQYLTEKGLDKNTIIVFTSDNGYYMGEHGLEGKWYGHEESIRIPLLVYDPRMPEQRRTVNEIALNIDLAPTLLQWAGVKQPQAMQGMPLQPLLKKKTKSWRNEFFYEHTYDPGSYPVYIPKTVGLVTPSWKYMRYYNGKESTGNVVYEELFHIPEDPFEKHNRVTDVTQQHRIATYKQKVAQYEQSLQ